MAELDESILFLPHILRSFFSPPKKSPTTIWVQQFSMDPKF